MASTKSAPSVATRLCPTNLNIDPKTKVELVDVLRNVFFKGFDISKIDANQLLLSLDQDKEDCIKRGIEPTPSEKSYELAGISKQDFLLVGEQVAATFNRHSPEGKKNRKRVKNVASILGSELAEVKEHILDLSNSVDRKGITELSKEWNVDLNIFKCHNCSKQQRDCESKLKRCGECAEVFYCSRDCQKSHWKEHKLLCNKSTQQCC